MAPSKSLVDDFILTLSDQEDLPVSSIDGDEAEVPILAKGTHGTKRKRTDEKQVLKGKKGKKQKVQGTKPLQAAIPNEDEPSSDAEEQGEQDGAIDPDFEFELGQNASTGIIEDFDGWGEDGDTRRDRNSKGNKKGVDIDDIIARRALKKAASGKKTSKDLDVEKKMEGGGYEDEDEQDEGEDFPSFEDDELLAPDIFGAGVESEDEEDGAGSEREAGSSEGEDRSMVDDDDDDANSDNDSMASPTAHPDDLVSDHSDSESQTSTSDIEEIAKRAAFFAPESKSQPTTSESSKASGFTSFSLSRPILRALTTLSFSDPTPIQTRTIPLALAGHDLVGSAVTGSGKTASFLLPILERLLYRPRRIPTTRVSILVPTRELAVQCHAVAVQLAKFTDITFALVVGGFSLREQEIVLRKRPDVVIATPGRFIDHMRNSASFTVENIEILVLDEADRMLEDGFADELDEILNTIPKSRQTMLFSATMTDKIDKLVRVGMSRPVRVSVDKKKATVGGLVQEFIRLRPGREDRRLATLAVVCTKVSTERTIVFFRQKKEAHRVRIVFGLLGLKAGELHGSMTQEQRISAVEAFRDGRMTHLLATDLASRGLDIKNVMSVVNYEAPQSHEIYVHRVGRTARAGKEGRACTIAAEPDRKVVKAAVKSARAQGAKVVSRVLEVKEVDAMHAKIQGLEEEVEAVMKEEQEEKQLAQAETQLNRGANMVKHEAEIMARPKRTWFESEKEKRISKKAGRVELNGPDLVRKSGTKGKLSGKDKKRLDDRRERLQGKIWRKGKGSEEASKAERTERKGARVKGGAGGRKAGAKTFKSSKGRK